MSKLPKDALHDIHVATNDVLKGYREMSARAQPEIQALISRLTQAHERHADEQAAELERWRVEAGDETSVQGTVNKVVVILRDWLSGLDRDVLPAVRDGEASLRDQYRQALEEAEVAGHQSVGPLLKAQMDAISRHIADLRAH
jgi:alkanesulfonate monooxygenase SsuD/methylene tetrahydromethanopterin reductase-like flavin-dependent oxidoreductase (luciferase family)